MTREEQAVNDGIQAYCCGLDIMHAPAIAPWSGYIALWQRGWREAQRQDVTIGIAVHRRAVERHERLLDNLAKAIEDCHG